LLRDPISGPKVPMPLIVVFALSSTSKLEAPTFNRTALVAALTDFPLA
jgi:hypothetical protein